MKPAGKFMWVERLETSRGFPLCVSNEGERESEKTGEKSQVDFHSKSSSSLSFSTVMLNGEDWLKCKKKLLKE